MSSTSAFPMIASMPQFGQGSTPDDLIAASPMFQSLLSQTGGNLSNVNSLAASNPQFGSVFSLMSPGGGISPQQGAAFGPLFSLLMALQGGGGQQR